MSRTLELPDCLNVRDLGGLHTSDGRVTGYGRLFRADNLNKLQPESAQALLDLGVRTVIDLRFAHELAQRPNPFADDALEADFHHLPLFELHHLADGSPLRGAPASSAWNIALLEGYGDNVARALRAIALAPQGAVLFHCHAGKDRTGVLALLMQAAAQVREDEILADYLESNARLEPLFQEILAKYAHDPAEQARVRPLLYGPGEMVTGTLAHLATRYGSAREYLLRIGLLPAELTALEARLGLEPPATDPPARA